MIASEVREMLSFIDGNPTAYHTTAAVRDILLKAGFAELLESRKWALEPGKDYFVCRNGSSIIAFRMGDQLENYSFNVAAARELAARAGVPLQYFANRSDKVGGSTLGNLAMAQVSMNCVDIGLPQLAMHSCYETAGAEDTLSLIKLMQELYSSHFEETAFGTLSISK